MHTSRLYIKFANHDANNNTHSVPANMQRFNIFHKSDIQMEQNFNNKKRDEAKKTSSPPPPPSPPCARIQRISMRHEPCRSERRSCRCLRLTQPCARRTFIHVLPHTQQPPACWRVALLVEAGEERLRASLSGRSEACMLVATRY